MLESGIKQLIIFSILLSIFLIKTHYTNADIFAERIVGHNKMSALSLDFSSRSSFNYVQITTLFHSLGMQPGGFELGSLKITPENNSTFKYIFKVLKTGGDEAFCNSLLIKVLDKNFSSLYSGSLMNLNLPSDFTNADSKNFIFVVSLDDNSKTIQNKTCKFNFDFKSYHASPSETGGIYAERVISNVISSGSW